MGGAGADSITVGGNTTQWLIDAGADADSLYTPTQLSAPQYWAEAELTVSTSVLFLRALFRLNKVTTPSRSRVQVLPVRL